MYDIRNDSDLRFAYYMLKFCKDSCQRPAAIPEIKRAIRKYQKRGLTTVEPERRVIQNDWDECTMLVELGWFRDKEEAEKYFKRYEYMERPYSAYDCTGKLFTLWYKIFKRHGLYYAYHRIGADV